MKNRKVWGMALAILASVLSISACSGSGNSTTTAGNDSTTAGTAAGSESTASETSTDWPKQDLHVLVGFSAGGTSDMGTRLLFLQAQPDLGVNVVVENVTGAGGWNAWSQLASSKPDGYTIALVTDPTIYGGYLDPSNNRKNTLDDFRFVCNQVMDDAAIAINPKDTRFTDLKSLIDYAKQNEVTCTTTGIGSQVHLMLLRMNDELGTKFVPLATKGTSEGKTMILGGNVDVFMACVGDIAPSHKSGELKCVAVSSEDRSEYMDDVPTMVELGYPLIHCYSSRGYMFPAGVDDAIVEKMDNILKKAMESPEHKKAMDDMCLRINYIGHEEFTKQMYDDEAMMKNYSDLFGWN